MSISDKILHIHQIYLEFPFCIYIFFPLPAFPLSEHLPFSCMLLETTSNKLCSYPASLFDFYYYDSRDHALFTYVPPNVAYDT